MRWATIFVGVLLAAGAALGAATRMSDAELRGEVAAGFLIVQEVGATLCEDVLRKAGIAHTRGLKKLETEFRLKHKKEIAALRRAREGYFRRLHGATWATELKARSQIFHDLVTGGMLTTTKSCKNLAAELEKRLNSPWSRVQTQLDRRFDKQRGTVARCG